MNLVVWLPAMFALGLVSLGLCLVVTIAVTGAVIVYLFTALVRPEWF